MSPRKERPAGNLAGLNRWISAWADESSVPAGRLRRRIGVMVLIGMLDRVRGDDGLHRFVLKGATALEVRLPGEARVSRDVDFLYRGALGDVHSSLFAAVESGWGGFSGRVLDPEELSIPWDDVDGHRIAVKLTYKGKPFVTLALEVVTTLNAEFDLVTAISLENVGLDPASEVPCLSLRYQIAEKLHAVSDRLDGERINDRVGDLMDLILVEDLLLSGADWTRIRSACVEVFTHRDRQAWPPVVEAQPTWPGMWSNLVDTNGFYVAAVEKAASRVNALVERIDEPE